MLQASVLWKRAAGLWQKRAAERSLILRLEHFPDKSSVVARVAQLPATGYCLIDRRRSSFYFAIAIKKVYLNSPSLVPLMAWLPWQSMQVERSFTQRPFSKRLLKFSLRNSSTFDGFLCLGWHC